MEAEPFVEESLKAFHVYSICFGEISGLLGEQKELSQLFGRVFEGVQFLLKSALISVMELSQKRFYIESSGSEYATVGGIKQTVVFKEEKGVNIEFEKKENVRSREEEAILVARIVEELETGADSDFFLSKVRDLSILSKAHRIISDNAMRNNAKLVEEKDELIETLAKVEFERDNFRGIEDNLRKVLCRLGETGGNIDEEPVSRGSFKKFDFVKLDRQLAVRFEAGYSRIFKRLVGVLAEIREGRLQDKRVQTTLTGTELDDEISNYRTRIKTLEDSSRASAARLAETEAALHALEVDRGELEARLIDATNSQRASEEKAEAAKIRRREAETKLREARAQLSNAAAQRASVDTQIRFYSKMLLTANETIGTLGKSSATVTKHIEALETRMKGETELGFFKNVVHFTLAHLGRIEAELAKAEARVPEEFQNTLAAVNLQGVLDSCTRDLAVRAGAEPPQSLLKALLRVLQGVAAEESRQTPQPPPTDATSSSQGPDGQVQLPFTDSDSTGDQFALRLSKLLGVEMQQPEPVDSSRRSGSVRSRFSVHADAAGPGVSRPGRSRVASESADSSGEVLLDAEISRLRAHEATPATVEKSTRGKVRKESIASPAPSRTLLSNIRTDRISDTRTPIASPRPRVAGSNRRRAPEISETTSNERGIVEPVSIRRVEPETGGVKRPRFQLRDTEILRSGNRVIESIPPPPPPQSTGTNLLIESRPPGPAEFRESRRLLKENLLPRNLLTSPSKFGEVLSLAEIPEGASKTSSDLVSGNSVAPPASLAHFLVETDESALMKNGTVQDVSISKQEYKESSISKKLDHRDSVLSKPHNHLEFSTSKKKDHRDSSLSKPQNHRESSLSKKQDHREFSLSKPQNQRDPSIYKLHNHRESSLSKAQNRRESSISKPRNMKESVLIPRDSFNVHETIEGELQNINNSQIQASKGADSLKTSLSAAGLLNLIFAQPQPKILEIHGRLTVFLRLSATRGVSRLVQPAEQPLERTKFHIETETETLYKELVPPNPQIDPSLQKDVQSSLYPLSLSRFNTLPPPRIDPPLTRSEPPALPIDVVLPRIDAPSSQIKVLPEKPLEIAGSALLTKPPVTDPRIPFHPNVSPHGSASLPPVSRFPSLRPRSISPPGHTKPIPELTRRASGSRPIAKTSDDLVDRDFRQLFSLIADVSVPRSPRRKPPAFKPPPHDLLRRPLPVAPSSISSGHVLATIRDGQPSASNNGGNPLSSNSGRQPQVDHSTSHRRPQAACTTLGISKDKMTREIIESLKETLDIQKIPLDSSRAPLRHTVERLAETFAEIHWKCRPPCQHLHRFETYLRIFVSRVNKREELPMKIICFEKIKFPKNSSFLSQFIFN